MTWLDLTALILATWRASSLLVCECGPFDVFLRLRSRFGIVPDSDGRPAEWHGGFLAGLFSCVWCISVWVGAGLYGIWYLSPIPIYILAASCGGILIEEARSWLLQKNPSKQ